MYHFVSFVLLLQAVFLVAPVHAGSGDPLSIQRQQFLDAEQALENGDRATFERLKRALHDYPLLPYLEYADLKRRLRRAGGDEIQGFLNNRADTPLAGLLRARWLNRLGKRGRWSDYLAFYTPQKSIKRQCLYLRALLNRGKSQQALDQVAAIWLHGKSRPDACDPVFAAWEKAGRRTAALTWQRIALAFDAGEWRLARYLGKKLDKKDRQWVERWVQLHRNPQRALRKLQRYRQAHPWREAMLAHGVRRMAIWDKLAALQAWDRLRAAFAFGPDLARRTERRLSFALMREDDPLAYAFLQRVQACDDDSSLQEARIRAALRRQDWEQVLAWLEQLPPARAGNERWRYWRARALQQTGASAAATELFLALARERSYYGFLAADLVDAEYALGHQPAPVSAEQVAATARIPGIRRASELFHLGRWIDGRREWRHATRDMEDADLMAAAKVAQTAGWADQAIFTLARSAYWDDLELRFPLKHVGAVRREARRQGLREPFVFAVVRQESAFMPEAHSPAGALGLMQLMPATARHVARTQLKQSPPRRSELLDPPTNISLGSAYLREMVDRFNGNNVLAIAAYNAGPHRVAGWLPDEQLPADIWIELIPFRETRSYVRRVLAYKAIYQARLGRKPLRLHQVMANIPPTA